MYAYFASKEALFEAALAVPQAFALIDRSFQGALRQQGSDAVQSMRQIAQGYLAMLDDPNTVNLMRIVISEGMQERVVANMFLEGVVRRGSRQVSAYLEGLGYGSREDLRLKVQAFFGMLFSWVLIHRLLAGPHKPTISRADEQQATAETAVEIFFHGLKRQKYPGGDR